MLLPSALTCDSSHQSITKQPLRRALFASPPLSPPSISTSLQHPAITNIYSTCRALQSMLSPSPPPSQLPSPPTTHADAPSSPFKLRLRARQNKDETQSAFTPRRKIAKRAAPPPRGINKRRREEDDEMTRDDVEASEDEEREEEKENGPSTPKRMRLAPEVLPLGLERGDFHTLHLSQQPETDIIPSIESSSSSSKPEEWSTEEDRMLVELVLEKLKLSKSDWVDCARSLGKDRHSVGRRWKSLMVAGDVGIKRTRGRAKIHGTWR